MNTPKPAKEEVLSFLNELTINKIDEAIHIEKLNNETTEFFLKTINYFALYLQYFYELPPIDENILDKFIHSFLQKFINMILPTQDVDIYTQSILNIGSICYFLFKKKNEISFFTILLDLIINYKSFIPKVHPNFTKMVIFLKYYEKISALFYSTTNTNLDENMKKEIIKEKNVQFVPYKEYHTINSTIANAFYLSGLFLEIRKYISSTHFFDDPNNFTKSSDIFSFLKACSIFMCNEYKSYFSSDLKDRLQQLDNNFSTSTSPFSSKFNNKNSLKYCKILREIADLSDENSNFFNELYFNTINNLINSKDEENYNSAIEELLSIPQLPYFSQNFIEKLSTNFLKIFIFAIKEKDSKVIEPITRLLNSKEMLPEPSKILEICSDNIFLYDSFFIYIQDLLKDSLINELFSQENNSNDESIQNVTLKEITAKLFVKLLDNGKYNESTKLNLIFRCLFNLLLNKKLFSESLIRFSEKNEFKEPIFQALSSIAIPNKDVQFNPIFMCKLLANLDSSLHFQDISKYHDFPFSSISENLIYELDAIYIPQYFDAYKFLPISDVELFWDLSVHSPLFYKLIQPKCDEIEEILLNCDEYSISLCECLLSLFEKTKRMNAFCRSVIIAYSLTTTKNYNENEAKDDYLLRFILKLKMIFNNLKKDEKTFENLIEIIENIDNKSTIQLSQFLSEVDLSSNINENANFSEIFNKNDLSLMNDYNDDKSSILISLLMIINDNAKIDEFVTNSLINKLFNSSSVFAVTVISRFISTRKISEDVIDSGLITYTFVEHSRLGNFNICKNLIDNLIISIDDSFIYCSNPEIIELIFNEKIPVQEKIFPIFNLLKNCQTYKQYETSLICLIKREPISEQLAPFLMNLILSKEFPSCMLNDKIIRVFMDQITESPIGFVNYISESPRIEFSEFKPSVNYPFLYVLSSFNDFVYDLADFKNEEKEKQNYKCNELASLLGNLRFTSLPSIKNETFSVSKIDNLYDYIPSNLLKYFKVVFTKDKEIVEDNFITLNGEKSVSYSLSKFMTKNNTIIKSSPVLTINFDQTITNSQLDIDETLDISCYSSNEVKFQYKLNSIVTEHNVYIYDPNHLNNELKNEPGFICYTKNATFFIKLILEPIKYIVYTTKSKIDDLILCNLLKSQRNSMVYDMGCIFMKLLNNPYIDWKSFKLTCPNFIDSAITIIHQLFLRPLFDTFCDDIEFSEHLFQNRFDVLYDDYFTRTFTNEIIRTAKTFPNKGLLMCILCDDVMNINEQIYFTLIESVDFDVDCHLYAISKMTSMYKENAFTDYFSKFIKSSPTAKEKVREIIKLNDKLVDVILKISDPSFIELLDDVTSIKLFRRAINSRPTFLSALLSKSPNDSDLAEKLRILSDKLYNNKLYQTLILSKMKEEIKDENQKILNLTVINNLLKSSDEDFRNEIIKEMIIEYPPESIKDTKIPNMITELLESTKDYEGLYHLVEIYHDSFRLNSKITGLFVRYLFSHRPSSVVDYDKMANLTLSLTNPTFIDFVSAMRNNFPFTETSQFKVMKNYSAGDIEKAYQFFFKLFGKCRFLKQFDTNKYDIEILLQACYSSLADKKAIVKLIEPLFFDYMMTDYVILLLVHIRRYPILIASYIDKITSYKCMKESYGFAVVCCVVSQMLWSYRERDVFYTSNDDIDNLIKYILNTVNNFLENVVLKTSFAPKVEHKINYIEMIYQIDVLLDTLKMLKHDARLELIRFYKNLAFSIPDFILRLINVFFIDGRNYYNFLSEDDERIALSNLVCEIFRECIGDRNIIPSQNSQNFFTIGNFLNSQFVKCLTCKYLNYKMVRPYLLLLKAIIKLPCYNPVKQSTVSTLAKNSYIYNLLTNLSISNKVLEIEHKEDESIEIKNDEILELQDFFFNLIDNGKYSENSNSPILNSKQISLAINKLKKDDEFFNYRVLLFDSIIRRLPDIIRREIVQTTFSFVEELYSDSENVNDPIQHLFDAYLENYEQI